MKSSPPANTRQVSLAAGVILLVAVLGAATARADSAAPPPGVEGAWTLGPVAETFTVQQWSSSCGPAPVSDTMIPGGPVTIRADGPELVITPDAAGRALRTDECLDGMPTLAREAHTADARSWRTRCATPPSDPRHAVVNAAYFLAPGDDAISIAETGRYEFTINGARCIADVKRSGSLARVLAAAGAATAAPPGLASASPPPNPYATSRVDCSHPGAAARLEVRPSRKLLRTGDTFAFHAVVLDANRCPTATPIQWTVGAVTFHDGQPHAGTPTVDASGKLSVPAQDFTDSSFDVIATAAGRSARGAVEVTSPANYEALLAQSGLDSNGERDEPAVAVLATSSIGATDARAEDGAARRRLTFVAIVAALALALGVVALVGLRRSRRAKAAELAAEERHAEKMREYERTRREREENHATQLKKHLESVAIAQQQAAAAAARGIESGPMFCPSCRREHPAGSTFCPFDSNRLVAVAGHAELMSGPAGGICPTCRRGFNPGVKVCPHDGEELVPAPVAGAAVPAQPTRGKICPTCGSRFDGSAGFCGKDGTQLVLLN